MAALLVQAARLTFAGAVATRSGAATTMKVLVAVLLSTQPPAILLAINVKLKLPPQVRSLKLGKSAKLFVGLQPPTTVKPAFHVL